MSQVSYKLYTFTNFISIVNLKYYKNSDNGIDMENFIYYHKHEMCIMFHVGAKIKHKIIFCCV